MAWAEEFFYQLMSYLAAQLSSLDHGVVIVDASVDSGGFHFLHQVICTVVSMRGVGDEAVDGELQFLRTEIARENCRDSAGDTAVCGGILRVGGSRCQRGPCWVARELGIAASRSYGGDRAPKNERGFWLPATNCRDCGTSSKQPPGN